jgi:WD40 repeat protein
MISPSWGLASKLQITSDGRRVVAWSPWDGIIHSYDTEIGAQQQDQLSAVGIGHDIYDVFLSEDDQMMAITLNNTLRIVDRQSNQITQELRGIEPEHVFKVAFSKDNKQFLVLQGTQVGGEANLTLFDAQSGSPLKHELIRALDVRFTEDRRVQALVVRDGGVSLEELFKPTEQIEPTAQKPEQKDNSSESQGIMKPTLDW